MIKLIHVRETEGHNMEMMIVSFETPIEQLRLWFPDCEPALLPELDPIGCRRLVAQIIRQAAVDAANVRLPELVRMDGENFLLSVQGGQYMDFVGADANQARKWVLNGCKRHSRKGVRPC